ncbi:MAG: gluconate:H+ symporter, partial [Gilliamella apicola]|nr:gluconate:H+ symporter [Gilliamella apicola]
MPLIIIAIGVALLLILMLPLRVNGFIALILVALSVGIMEGMPVMAVVQSIKNGVGGTLGNLALIMGFGAMLGKLLADCGGAQRIATTLINTFGDKKIQWAVTLTGFIVGFALFYEVGFVLLLPLVLTIAATLRISPLYIGIPMAAALSVTHGFLPPHPGPTAIAEIFNADMGRTLLYGTIIGIPTVILAGPVLAKMPFIRAINHPIEDGLYNSKQFTDEQMPSFVVSVFTALIPVVLMSIRAVCEMTLPKGHLILPYVEFFGDPIIATLISVIVAVFTFGIFRGRSMAQINTTLADSI